MNVDFGVFSLSSLIYSGDFTYYFVKYVDQYYVFSAKDPMLVTNLLLELHESYPENLSLEIIFKYIKELGSRRASNLDLYIIFSKSVEDIKYIYPWRRYDWIQFKKIMKISKNEKETRLC